MKNKNIIQNKNKGIYSETLKFDDNDSLSLLCGEFDKNLKLLESEANVKILPRGNLIAVNGEFADVKKVLVVLEKLYKSAKTKTIIDYGELRGTLNMVENYKNSNNKIYNTDDNLAFKAGRRLLKPRSKKQAQYFKSLKTKELIFCCGPAGTGKTYLAVAFAVSMLKAGQVERIILSRPAVEAGERLGFLPGDLKEKIDPYLRPIYDALNDMLPMGEVLKKIDSGQIEIAPIAFMRGRTLSNSFIILDESQNTTSVQMKMFLTRLGENSKMVINGDLSQVDLPAGTKSGLRDAIMILKSVNDIGFIEFKDEDIVRNSLVSKIVSKYENFEKIEGIGKNIFLIKLMKIEIRFTDIKESHRIKKLTVNVLKSSIDELNYSKCLVLEISILIVSVRKIKSMNLKYRNINKPTNVLAFPQIDRDDERLFKYSKTALVGDIVLSPTIIRNESKSFDLRFDDHFSHILIHGLLHLFGYDHRTQAEAKKMQEKEISILEKIKIRNPYIN